MSALRIGILVDSSLKHQYLSNMVQQAGHSIGCAHIVKLDMALPNLAPPAVSAVAAPVIDLSEVDVSGVDAWIVDVREPDEHEAEREQHTALRAFLDGLLQPGFRYSVAETDVHELVPRRGQYPRRGRGSNANDSHLGIFRSRVATCRNRAALQESSPSRPGRKR